MDFYQDLIKDAVSLKPSNSIDDFLDSNRVKVASLNDLLNFARIGGDTLVHKAEKDLWKISEDEKGQVVIERLFDPSTNEPLKV